MNVRNGRSAVKILASKFQVVTEIRMKHCKGGFLLGHPVSLTLILVRTACMIYIQASKSN